MAGEALKKWVEVGLRQVVTDVAESGGNTAVLIERVTVAAWEAAIEQAALMADASAVRAEKMDWSSAEYDGDSLLHDLASDIRKMKP